MERQLPIGHGAPVMGRGESTSFQFSLRRQAVTPLFRQMLDAVIAAVAAGRLRRGDRLPTVARVCREQQVARETVLKAYGQLKARGILSAAPRHGYFVASEAVARELNVLLLFDEFTPYKQQLFHGFKDALGADAAVDLFFHHYRADVFQALLREKAGRYSHYVVMPFPAPAVVSALGELPASQVLVLDRLDTATAAYPRLGQEFQTAVEASLEAAWERLRRYARLRVVLPVAAPYFPAGVAAGTSFP